MPNSKFANFAIPTATCIGLFLSGTPLANPTNGRVVQGQSTISSAGPETTIRQTTDVSSIVWDSFDILLGESVRFIQPGAHAVSVNSVQSNLPTSIHGNLQANGQVWLSNPNGLLIGNTAVVDVGGLLLTSARVDPATVGSSRIAFSDGSGAVINRGQIETGDGGAVLIAPHVENTGTIVSNGGDIRVSAAKAFTVDPTGDGLLGFVLDEDSPALTEIIQGGQLHAQGGSVELIAHAAEEGVIQAGGVIEATGVSVEDGRIVLTASDQVGVSGTVRARRGDTGGTVEIGARDIAVLGDAEIDVSGPAGGGEIDIGARGSDAPAERVGVLSGARLDASAQEDGDAGRIEIWSEDITFFDGDIVARGAGAGDGGFVDISGAQGLWFRGTADVSAPNGTDGSVLFDPAEIIVEEDLIYTGDPTDPPEANDGVVVYDDLFDGFSNTGILTPDFLQSIDGDLILEATDRIIVRDPLTLGDDSITLRSRGEIIVGAEIETTTGDITIEGEQDAAGTLGYVSIGRPTSPPDGTGEFVAPPVDLLTSDDGDITIRANGPIEIFDNVVTDNGNLFVESETGHVFVEARARVEGENVTLLATQDLFFQDVQAARFDLSDPGLFFVPDLQTVIANGTDPDDQGVIIEAGGIEINGVLRSEAGIILTATGNGTGSGIGDVIVAPGPFDIDLARDLLSAGCTDGVICIQGSEGDQGLFAVGNIEATAPGYIGIGSPQRPPILDIATSTSGDIIFNATGPIEIFDNVVAETGDLSATSRAGHIFVESTATISGGSASFSAPNDLFFQDNLFGTDLITIIASDPNGSGVNIEAGGVQIRGSIRSAAGIDITATSQGSGTGIGAVDFLNRDDTTTPLARTLVSSACNGGTACDPITTENGSIQAATDIVLTAERWFYEKPISSGTSFTVNMVDVVDGDMIFFRGAVPSAPVLNFNTDGPLIVEGFDINDPVVQEVNFQIEGRVTLDGDLSVGSGANLSELDFQYSGGADLDGSIDLGNASLTFQDNGSGRFRLPGEESIMAGTTTVSSTEYQIDGSISGDQVRLTFSGDGQLGGPDAPADGGLDNSELERITPNALTVDSLGSLTILDFQPDYNTGIPTDVTFTASGDIEVLGNVIGTYSPQQDVLNISFGEDGGRRPTGVDVFGLLGFTDTGIEDQATSFQFYVDGDVNINPSAGTFAPGDTIVSAGTLVVDVTGDFLQVNSSDPDGTPELSHGFGGTGLNVDSVELRNANRLELYGTIGGQDAADARDGVAVAPGFTVNDLHQVNDCSLAIANCNIEPVAVDDFVATDSPAPITLNVLNNDSDGDAGDVLTVISISEPSNGGVFEFNADGEVVFQPAEIFNALPLNQTVTTSIDYTVDDGFGGTAEATLTVQVFRPVPEEVIDVVNTIPQLPRDTATTFEREGPLSPNEERIFGIFEEFAYSRPLLEVDEPIVNRGNDEEWGR